MVSVEFKNVMKCFDRTVAADDVSLKLEEGELFFLLGPSGCGKTTCLRMVAGFLEPDSGSILFGGNDMGRTPPHRRNVGMVFQTYALFPHMTVEQNIAYGLRFRKTGSAEKKKRVAEILEKTRLDGLGGRLPAQLSGGQQQRVALARALVIQPDILLLDEPLSNLDTKLRGEVREEIRRIHREFKITSLYVTHDQDEALSLADRIAVMRDGRIVQVGTPEEIYSRPRNAFVAKFVGETNIMKADFVEKDGCPGFDTPAGWVAMENPQTAPGKTVEVSVRPEALRLVPYGEGTANGRIENMAFYGSTAKICLTLEDGAEITAMAIGSGVRWKEGDKAGVVLEAGGVVILE